MLQPALHQRALGASLREEHDYWTHPNVSADLAGRLDRKGKIAISRKIASKKSLKLAWPPQLTCAV